MDSGLSLSKRMREPGWKTQVFALASAVPRTVPFVASIRTSPKTSTTPVPRAVRKVVAAA